MTLKELYRIANKQKKYDERLKAAQKTALIIVGVSAVGIAIFGVSTGILFATKFGEKVRLNMKSKTIKTIDAINETIQNRANKVKDSANQALHNMADAIENFDNKTEGVKNDIRDGFIKIDDDLHKTADNISNEFKK